MVATPAGAAFISVLPDMSGFNRAVRTDLDKIGPQIGVRIGEQIGKGIAEGLGKSDPFGPLDRKQQEQQRKAPRDGDAQAGAFAAAFQKRLKAAFASLPKANIDADSSEADRKLQELRARLEALSKKTIGVDVDAGEALGELAAVKADLEDLSRSASVNVRADVASALAQIGAVEREVEKVGGQSPTVTVDADTAAADTELAVTDREVSRLDGRTANVNVNANVGGALAGLFSVRTALLSLGVAAAPAIVGVGAGLLGLAGPLAAAGAGFGGLAAVAVPAISHVKAALDAQNKAAQSSGVASGQAQQRALAQAGAEQQLAAAVRQAAYAHQQALQQVQQAEQQLTQAQQSAANAQRDLTKARAEAARQLQDMSNNVADAKLSERQATFDLEDAQKQYNLTVSNPQATKEQIARAQLALDQAKQQLKERHLATQRAIADEAAAKKAGVDGADAVISARQRLAQADQQVTNAELAVANARANVARTDQQSADQIASARRALEQASLSAASGTSALGTAMTKLTPLEQQTLVAAQGLSSAFKDWSTSLQPAVLPTLISGINLVRASLPLLTPIVQSAAVAVGNLFRQAQAAAQSPFWRQFSAFLGQTAGPAITQFGSILGRLVTGLAGLVQAFAPIGFAFLTVLNTVATRFQAFAAGLATSPGFRAFVTQMTNLAPLLASTFSTIGSLLGSVLAALAPAVTPAIAFINTLGTTLTGVVRAIGPAVQSVLATLGPALGSVVQALGPVLTQLVQALAPLLVQLINGLAPILTGLAPIVGTLISALQPLISGLLSALGPILLSLVPLVATLARAFAQVLAVIAPILAPLGQLITQMVQALLPVLQPIIALLAQVSAQVGRQMVSALIQVMPPLLVVVKAIASLLPAITPLIPMLVQLQTAFLPLIPPLAQLIAALVTLLVPVLRVLIVVVAFVVRILLSALVPVIRLLVVVVVAVVNAITVAVRALGPIFTWLYQVIIKPVIDATVIAFRALATAATWLWRNILSPIFTFIGTAAKVMAAIILFVVVAPMVVAFKLIAATVTWLWTNVIKPNFTIIGAFISTIWHNVVRPLFAAWVAYINTVIAPVIRWLYNSIVRPLFSSIGSAISSVWNGVIRPAFNALSSAIGAVGTAFSRGASAIKSAWDRVKGYTKDPINFVIGTVYNRGIVGTWNKVMSWLHLPGNLQLGTIPLLASGGTLNNPMAAQPFITNGPMAIVGEGDPRYPEYVIPTDPRYRGRARSLWAAAGGDLQMLAGGGVLGSVLGGVKKIAGGVLNLVKDAVAFIANPKAIWDKLTAPILSQVAGLRTSPWGQAAAAIPGQMLGEGWNALSQILKAWNAGYGGDAAGVVTAAKKYIGIGDDRGPNNNIFSRAFGMPGAPWCAMFVSTAIKDAHATKKYPGAPTAAVATFASNMHHVGLDQGRPGDLAIYYSPPHHVNIIESKVSGGYMTIGGNQNALVQRGVRGGQTGILRPLARGGTLSGSDVWQVFGREAVGNADPHELSTPLVRLMRSLGPGTASQVASAITKNHLGVIDAAYDSGGYLPPGMSTVWNGTGAPEPVLTSAQWDSVHAAASGGSRDIRQFEGSTFVLQDPVDVDLVMQRAEFAARAASL